ncbi:MAG: hypothetical protein OXI01_14405 [Albidovulum sp.]|nr:hypothetical protein [Albidovulum sp.]
MARDRRGFRAGGRDRRRLLRGAGTRRQGRWRGRDEPAIDRADRYDYGSSVGSVRIAGNSIAVEQGGSGPRSLPTSAARTGERANEEEEDCRAGSGRGRFYETAARAAVGAVFVSIVEALARREDISIIGFDRSSKKDRPAREGPEPAYRRTNRHRPIGRRLVRGRQAAEGRAMLTEAGRRKMERGTE